MKKLLNAIMAGLLLLVGISAMAANPNQNLVAKARAFTIGAGTQSMPGSKSILLRLSIQDSKPKSGVCPYYVRSLHFIDAIQLLDIEVFQEICLNEAYGYSQGEALWIIPSHLQQNGKQVSVLVNGTKAGALVFDEARGSFVAKGE